MIVLNDAIIEHKTVGVCLIDIDIVIKAFTKECSISRWHDEYRLIKIENEEATFKITISSEDAKELIKRLGLEEQKSEIFNNASTFRIKNETL